LNTEPRSFTTNIHWRLQDGGEVRHKMAETFLNRTRRKCEELNSRYCWWYHTRPRSAYLSLKMTWQILWNYVLKVYS